MKATTCAILLSMVLPLALLPAANAAGDTVYLKNGVQIDGQVTELDGGVVRVRAGGRTVIYRPHEVARVEENNRTGVLDREAAIARWQARDEELTRITGLNADQRRRVKNALYRLQREGARRQARQELMGMQEEMDVFRYLAWRLPGLSDRLSPWVLETMAFMDAKRTLPHLREALEHVYYGTRAMAIDLLAQMRDRQSTGKIARGLVDHAPEVQHTAAAAMGRFGIRAATPALIELLGSPDPRVKLASRQALAKLWEEEVQGEDYDDWQQWIALWKEYGGNVEGAFQLTALDPLIRPEEEFQDE
ncbi:MAG: HEAT repeat domain-containing protein [Candidatus Hydrogenedentota bacterium]